MRHVGSLPYWLCFEVDSLADVLTILGSVLLTGWHERIHSERHSSVNGDTHTHTVSVLTVTLSHWGTGNIPSQLGPRKVPESCQKPLLQLFVSVLNINSRPGQLVSWFRTVCILMVPPWIKVYLYTFIPFYRTVKYTFCVGLFLSVYTEHRLCSHCPRPCPFLTCYCTRTCNDGA